MLRCVRQRGGEVAVDLKHSQFGRGAYICVDVRCIRKVSKIGALKRAFKANIKLEIFDCLDKIAKKLEDSFERSQEP
jgi:predicted RNA-binding protein YlxR (DUF448 family)